MNKLNFLWQSIKIPITHYGDSVHQRTKIAESRVNQFYQRQVLVIILGLLYCEDD